MTELRSRKTDSSEGDKEEDETPKELELETTRADGSASVGGERERQQKEGEGKGDDALQERGQSNRPSESSVKRSKCSFASGLLQRLARLFFGCLAAVACGVLYAIYMSLYHDRKFWFSMRQELEREITFQGGSGFYYYYYKHLLTAPSFERGLYELMVDNRTLSGQTINAVERFSLYPEVITSFVYRLTGGQVRWFLLLSSF